MDRRIRYNGNTRLKQKKISWLRVSLFLVSILFLGLVFSSTLVQADYRLKTKPQENILDIMYGSSGLSFKDSSVKLITILNNKDKSKILTNSLTVKDVLEENNIILDENDYTNPTLSSYLHNNEVIEVIHKEDALETRQEVIPFTTVQENDNRVPMGTKVIKQKGVNGSREIVVQKVFENGVLKEEKVISTKIVLKPINQEVHIGTKPATIQSCSYWDKIIDENVSVSNKTKNTWMKFIMRKETWCDSGQVTSTRVPGVSYLGLYQFTPHMFRSRGGKNIFDGEEQIKIVSGMYDQGEAYRNLQWGTSNKLFHQLYPNLK